MNDSIVCVKYPPMVTSMGLWDRSNPFKYSIPALELQMIVIFSLTQLIYYPLKRFGFHKLLSEIIAGVIIGPTMPQFVRKYTSKLFPVDTQLTIAILATFGYTLLLFLIGVKSDVTMVRRTGKKAFAIGFLSPMVPLAIGMGSRSFVVRFLADGQKFPIKVVVAIQSLSPFPSIALLLKDLKILNSELGRLALSSAMISELVSVSVVSVMTLYRVYKEKNSLGRIFADVGLFACFVLVILFIIRPAMVWVVKQTPEGRPVKDIYTYSIILVVLMASVFTHWVELLVLFGAFIVGLAVPAGPPLGSALVDKLEPFVSGLFVPIFITINTSRANFRTIFFDSSVYVYAILLPVLFLAKLAGCMLPAFICKMPFNDVIALGLIMSAKGAIEMSSYSFARDSMIITEQTMALMIASIAFAAVVIPICVRKFYDPSRKFAGYQRRNIIHSKHDGELRIVACIHRTDNIAGIINLLDTSGPTKDSPIAIYVLHLIELRGQSSAHFISHQLQKKTSYNQESYSANVLVAFGQYERNNLGAIYAQIFTAISPCNLMYEDMCNLALDKVAALIIIPFHRKWDIFGSVEFEDQRLRVLNCKILDRAPCSVGILIDRGLTERQASCSVAMLFFGGNDDREALAYARRLARNGSIGLTVVHFVATQYDGANEKERLLDEVSLKSMDQNKHVAYKVEKVNEGAQTAMIVRRLVDEHDLIIVGTRDNVEYSPQTVGLEEWSEFSELGVIGDLLASIDGKCRASILVIQRQRHMIY
ncbi:hypothetical protein RJ639_045147 [Escallonia herrerae]|uniref:Cation/H+ exchanger domain-containing protein n=1 Tax=Escallonia herrerae TaxID=1293975 RepID=A0AA89B3W9_9ASTE|nr:hypothetical protein RJ639_045147 [Escallonia herrerae]